MISLEIIYRQVTLDGLESLYSYMYAYICKNNNQNYAINLKRSQENMGGVEQREQRQSWIEKREEGK